MHRSSVKIANHEIGNELPVFVIAEAGVNHNGDMNLAEQMIDVAADAGADAVKFQSFKADRLVTRSAKQAAYQSENSGIVESQHAMLTRYELSAEDHVRLIKKAQVRKIMFLSTPFDEESADLLQRLELPAMKVSSGDLTNLPFLKHLSHLGKTVILSTGMGSLGEIEKALVALGNCPVCLLHCTTEYPARFENLNLKAIHTLKTAFGVPVGYSDHSLGIEVPMAATALGATVIEKHFTLDRQLPGPDHKASLEPTELKQMISGIRRIELAIGNSVKKPSHREQEIALVARKSLVSLRSISQGTKLEAQMLGVLRPGDGIASEMLESVLGLTLTRDLAAGETLRWEHFK